MTETGRRESSAIAARLIEWHRHAGRHDLPWQQNPTPYRVWISEIMLQQTQVATVIPYYLRFLERFPDIESLASAPGDEVLHLWSGLGYYARARNLQRAAVRMRDEHAGKVPESFAALAALPGVGRSTAGAILALARGMRLPILDGNARRVLACYFAVAGARGELAAEKRLWELAERCTPATRIAQYTQAIMDLGATVCVRRRPLCAQCPLAAGCLARRSGRQHELPAPRRAPVVRRVRRVFMLIALQEPAQVRLERRPESGVWGGLWCLPEFATASAAAAYARDTLGADCAPRPLEELEHAFTHFDLAITPLLVHCAGTARVEEPRALWYNLREPARVGLPAPIGTLLARLGDETLC